ncbi:hypothetical protein Syun_003832 [Stephania yunnanensis]|uniref:Uncharacterized protein n=1 Tax=Stephania yunnanensis TaxID=152371 RepID=A0AAP0L4H1_9MAGN
MDYSYTLIRHRKICLKICAFRAIFHYCSPRLTPSFAGFLLQSTRSSKCCRTCHSTLCSSRPFVCLCQQLTHAPGKAAKGSCPTQSNADTWQPSLSQQRHHNNPRPIAARNVTHASKLNQSHDDTWQGMTPCPEVGLVGTEGIVEASELGGGYGGFGGKWLRFLNYLQQGFHFLMQELSEALMSSPDENGDFVKLESSLSLKGKNAAMVLCWLLGNGCLFAWNECMSSYVFSFMLMYLGNCRSSSTIVQKPLRGAVTACNDLVTEESKQNMQKVIRRNERMSLGSYLHDSPCVTPSFAGFLLQCTCHAQIRPRVPAKAIALATPRHVEVVHSSARVNS